MIGPKCRCKSGISATMEDQVSQSTPDTKPSEAYVLHRTVVLVGMMGSGKTAIGRALAQRLAVPYVDSDAEIETAANATISEIFERSGEPFFRDREAEVIARLLQSEPCVLSTGGGAYLAARNRTAITKHGVAIWLDADLDLLWERVRHKDTRPLLRTADPRATLGEIFTQRAPVYGCVSPNLAVIADFHAAQLRNLAPALGLRHQAKSIGS